MSNFQYISTPEDRKQFANSWTASSHDTGPFKDSMIDTKENFAAENLIYSSFGNGGNGYVLDSDLETIEEESSICESELDDYPSNTRDGNSESKEQHSGYGNITNFRQITQHESSTASRQPVGAIDPNIHERIVYAKCLSPENANHVQNSGSRNAEYTQHRATKNNRQYGLKEMQTTSTQEYFVDEAEKNELPISHMFEAVRTGNLQALYKFSAAEQNETVDERGNTILHAASAAGQLAALTHLANGSFKEMVSPLNDDMMTPTALAVQYGHFRCVQWMIDNTKAKGELIVSLRQASIDGSNMRPPLVHVAARNGRDEILDWICDKMAKENHPIDAANHHSNTAAHEAAAYGHMKCLQILVGRGASVNTLNSSGDTPGQVADKNGHDLCVGYLVVVETCMSLAQQLIASKLENEGVREENQILRSKIQDLQEAALARAKESVEKRINATLRNVPSSEQYNEGIGAKDDENMSTKRNSESHENCVLIENEVAASEKTGAGHYGLLPGNVSAKGAKVEFSENQTQETNSLRQTRTESPVNASKSHLINSPENANEVEIQKLTQGSEKTMNDRSNTSTLRSQTRTQQTPAAKAWERMAMDDVLKLARDSRYLPSPTISMCTEDSTMETREAMRDRLAEASRWFLVQQSTGRPKTKNLSRPRHRQRGSRSDAESAKTVTNSAGSISLWESRLRDPTQYRSPLQGASQSLIAATNKEYGLLNLHHENKSSQAQRNNVTESTRVNLSSEHSLGGPNVSSSGKLTRSSSGKSSSSIISSTIGSCTSTLSKSTSDSQETVIEEKSSAVRNVTDPLHKKGSLGSPSPSRVSSRNSSNFDDTHSTDYLLNHKVTTCDQLLTATDSAVVRVALPTRNNSFLRKVQPTSIVNQVELLSPPSTKISYPVVVSSPPMLSSAITNVNQPNKAVLSPHEHPSSIQKETSFSKGTGAFMWRPRSATTSENTDLKPASGDDLKQPTESDVKKQKSPIKSIQRGLFSSSPAASRKKTLKLFHF